MKLKEMRDRSVLNRVSEAWVVFSEPMEMPTAEQYDESWVSEVHGVFDAPEAAAQYADVLFHRNRDRCYGYERVPPMIEGGFE